MSEAPARILEAIARWQRAALGPLVVAIDGHGAAGKTTIAEAVAGRLGARVLHTDAYFRETDDPRDARPMARYYDWRALRRDALEPAIAELAAAPAASSRARVLLLEGVSAAAPALADLVTRTVFIATPEALRLERLHARVSPEEWDEAWLAAERVYFAGRPPDSFDLVVSGAG